ncbi:hypothetical protein ACFZAV_32650 [Streptomyces sp. NPDC008343]|uniref:hypothetical protein n=1 Tax=Streptomyces sp. NPDC008343 TaxID=3364828 RepID=UPI0036E0AD85
MGAGGWEYVTAYKGSVEESLAVLHEQEFAELYGNDDEYGSIEELWADGEFMGNEGTHSILDIQRVVHTTAPPSEHVVEDYFTLRPLPADRIVYRIGSDRPTPERFQEVLDASHAAHRPFHTTTRRRRSSMSAGCGGPVCSWSCTPAKSRAMWGSSDSPATERTATE